MVLTKRVVSAKRPEVLTTKGGLDQKGGLCKKTTEGGLCKKTTEPRGGGPKDRGKGMVKQSRPILIGWTKVIGTFGPPERSFSNRAIQTRSDGPQEGKARAELAHAKEQSNGEI